MRINSAFIFLLLSSFLFPLFPKDSYRFRLLLTDKHTTPYLLSMPEDYLSGKAIERRNKYHIPIEETDLPVSPEYLSVLEDRGMKIITKSKWMNSVVVECNDSLAGIQLAELPFVHSVKLVWLEKDPTLETIFIMNERYIAKEAYGIQSITSGTEEEENYYGEAYTQIKMHNGDLLHAAGYKGKGIIIAVIDAGFSNVNQVTGLKEADILKAVDFSGDGEDVYSETINDHGTKVFSLMAANLPYKIVGTAPEASFLLLRSEVSAYEFPIEEDFWIAAAEYADSIGADVITSSLGYTLFNPPTESYTLSQLDGKTAFITQGANIAAGKGMLICSSAGNEGDKDWKYVSFPGDGEEILTVGAVTANKVVAPSSSRGPTADGRIKPDVMGMGVSCTVLNKTGNTITGSGTSFSTPIVAGLLACLWQAFPHLSPSELQALVKKYASQSSEPDNTYGYGIPDVYRIYLSQTSSEDIILPDRKEPSVLVDVNNHILHIDNLNYENKAGKNYIISINSPDGSLLNKIKTSSSTETVDTRNWQKGMYIVSIRNNEESYKYKICK